MRAKGPAPPTRPDPIQRAVEASTRWVGHLARRTRERITEWYQWIGRKPDYWFGYDPGLDAYLLPLVQKAGWVSAEDLAERVARRYGWWEPDPPDAERIERWLMVSCARRLIEPAPDNPGFWGIGEQGRRRMSPVSGWWAKLLGGVAATAAVLGLLSRAPATSAEVASYATFAGIVCGVSLVALFFPTYFHYMVSWGIWTPPAWKRDADNLWPPRWPDDRRPPPLPDYGREVSGHVRSHRPKDEGQV